jgi:hypothetical protein
MGINSKEELMADMKVLIIELSILPSSMIR